MHREHFRCGALCAGQAELHPCSAGQFTVFLRLRSELPRRTRHAERRPESQDDEIRARAETVCLLVS